MKERYTYDSEEGFVVDMAIVDEHGLGVEMLTSEVVERLNMLQEERDALVRLLFDMRKIFRERVHTYSADDAVILKEVSLLLMEHGMDEATRKEIESDES